METPTLQKKKQETKTGTRSQNPVDVIPVTLSLSVVHNKGRRVKDGTPRPYRSPVPTPEMNDSDSGVSPMDHRLCVRSRLSTVLRKTTFKVMSLRTTFSKREKKTDF